MSVATSPISTDAAVPSKRSSEISFVQLSAHFGSPISEAARELGVCTTLLKKLCRRAGLQRWPYRKLRSIENRISELQGEGASPATNEELANLTAQRLSILRAPSGASTVAGVAGSRKAGKLAGKGSAAALLKKKQLKASLGRSASGSDFDDDDSDDDTLDDDETDERVKPVLPAARVPTSVPAPVMPAAGAAAMVDPAAMAAYVQHHQQQQQQQQHHHHHHPQMHVIPTQSPYYAAVRAAAVNGPMPPMLPPTMMPAMPYGQPMMHAAPMPVYHSSPAVSAPAVLPPALPLPSSSAGASLDDDLSDSTSFSDDLAGSSDEDSYPHLTFNRPVSCRADDHEWAEYSDCLFPLSDLSALHAL